MLLAEIENGRNTLLVEFPCKRMMLAEHLASIGISKPASRSCAQMKTAILSKLRFLEKASLEADSLLLFLLRIRWLKSTQPVSFIKACLIRSSWMH